MPEIKHLCINTRKGGVKRPVAAVRFEAERGIAGDVHAGQGHRQVSLLAAEDIAALGKAGIRPGAFGENVITSGVDLGALGAGSRLRLGTQVVLQITQAGKSLHPPSNVVRVTGDYIMARSGLYARVEQGGEVRSGDALEVIAVVPRDRPQAVVLTISDRCARGETIDTAGPAIVKRLEDGLQAHIYRTEIIPDDRATIAARLRHYCDEHAVDLLFTVGGTGPAPRDVTPEATREVVERPTPGFDEAMRYASLAKTPTAILSRGTSGIRGATFIVNLPGSERAAVENLEAIIQALPHGVQKLRGHPADCGCCSRPRTVEKKAEHA